MDGMEKYTAETEDEVMDYILDDVANEATKRMMIISILRVRPKTEDFYGFKIELTVLAPHEKKIYIAVHGNTVEEIKSHNWAEMLDKAM